MAVAIATATARGYTCARCGRKLKTGRWVYSRFTGFRYCWPGTGCAKARRR
jgi:hypothetical protein